MLLLVIVVFALVRAVGCGFVVLCCSVVVCCVVARRVVCCLLCISGWCFLVCVVVCVWVCVYLVVEFCCLVLLCSVVVGCGCGFVVWPFVVCVVLGVLCV